MGEPAGGIVRGDGGESLPGRGAEGVIGSGPCTSKGLLDLGEGVLDGVEVGRVGRQKEESGTSLLNGGPCACGMVGAQVVSDDDLARSQRRGQDVADIPFEAGTGHAAVKARQGADTVEGECPNHGLVLTGIPRRSCVGSLTTWCPSVPRGVAEMAAGLVQKHQIVGRETRSFSPPCRTQRRILFARPQRLFYATSPTE